jgi:TolA-binding protein
LLQLQQKVVDGSEFWQVSNDSEVLQCRVHLILPESIFAYIVVSFAPGLDFPLSAAGRVHLHWRVMARVYRSFLILVTLLCGGASLCAAASAENRAYSVAEKAFQIQSWEYAEKKFGEFLVKYPGSSRAPEAVLFQARARYRLDRFNDVVGLLSANRAGAGILEDDYLYWIAQAHVQMTNYRSAAGAFAELGSSFPASPRRLGAAVAEAAAIARLGDWSGVTALLQDPAGAFQQTVQSEPTNELVIRGWLLLGEAQLVLGNLSGVQTALEPLSAQRSSPELTWRREYLRCRWQLAAGQIEAAWQNTSNLLVLADASAALQQGKGASSGPDAHGDDGGVPAASLLSESWSFRAAILERLNRLEDAIAALGKNLATNAPVDQQRHALFKIAGLYLARGEYGLATRTLENYLDQYPNSEAADMALLTIGELELRQYELGKTNAVDGSAAGQAVTNLVEQALARFDRLLSAFPASPLAGKALLDKGWCFWVDDRFARSLELFRQAAECLPLSEDQAVARFKWADAQFALRDFAGARTNYSYVTAYRGSLPALDPRLLELALYQTVRAALPDDMDTATRALRRILDTYPDGFAGPHCLLLLGQGLAQRGDPAAARGLFVDFEKAYPTNALLPEVLLAVARSYEREEKWEAAAAQYGDWIGRFTNHAELPRAEFSRAWDNFMAGQAPDAFIQFTNFIGQFPTNELAQQAQWWVADYYFAREQFHDAESSYQWVYRNTNWAPSLLSYQAQMMAGRAAMASLGYKDAFGYFTNLAGNPSCPLDLRIQASFAAGDACMSRADLDATNRFQEAVSWFDSIPQFYPTHALAAPALGRLGDCYLQLGDLEKSSNTYQRVISLPQARIAARSQATIGLGLLAERRAKLETGNPLAQNALLNDALGRYQDVFFYENILRDGEQADPFWVKKAGLEAARVAESLQQWQTAAAIYRKLEEWIPQMRPALEKKILNAQKNLARQRESD